MSNVYLYKYPIIDASDAPWRRMHHGRYPNEAAVSAAREFYFALGLADVETSAYVDVQVQAPWESQPNTYRVTAQKTWTFNAAAL